MTLSKKIIALDTDISKNPWTNPKIPWEDIVADYLETGCFLSEEKSSFLVTELRLRNLSADSIEIHSAFSIGDIVIPIMREPSIRECWLFYPSQLEIRKCSLGNA